MSEPTKLRRILPPVAAGIGFFASLIGIYVFVSGVPSLRGHLAGANTASQIAPPLPIAKTPRTFSDIQPSKDHLAAWGIRTVAVPPMSIRMDVSTIGNGWESEQDNAIRKHVSNERYLESMIRGLIVEHFSAIGIAVTDTNAADYDAILKGDAQFNLLIRKDKVLFVQSRKVLGNVTARLDMFERFSNQLITSYQFGGDLDTAK